MNLYQYGLLNPIRYNDPTGLSEEEGIFAKIGRKFEEAKSSLADAIVKPFRDAVKQSQENFARRAGDNPETAERSANEHADAQAGRSREVAKKMVDSAAEGGLAILGTKGLGGLAAQTNKIKHIFGKSEHKLDELVTEFGSQEKAFKAMQDATQATVKSNDLRGVFETTVRVGSQDVVVRGKVIDGVAKIGTAFRP